MMSAAVLMMVSAEQTSLRPASTEQGTTEDVSFAKSFHDRVGEPNLLLAKSTTEGAATALPALKAAMPAKELADVAEMLDGVKGKTFTAPEISEQGALKSVAPRKIVDPHAPTSTEPRGKVTANDVGTTKVEPPVDEGDDVDVVPSSSPAPYAVPSFGLANENLVAPVSIAEEEPLVSHTDSPAIQKQTVSIGKTKEIASSKKTAKALENTATSRIGQKAVGTEVNTTSKPTVVIVREDAIPIVQGVAAGVVVPRNDAGKTMAEGFNKVISTANASSEVSFTTAGRSIHKEADHGTKAVAEPSETAVPSSEGQPMLPKSEMTVEKTGTTAIPAGIDGGSKGLGGPEVVIAMVHSIAGAVQVSGTSPTALVAGNTSGELSTAKSPAGDAGVHTAGLPAGSSEPDRPGVVTASMNEAPRMLTATPTALEVGIQNGTHGWLRVRAEMADGGVVNASVSAGSSTGQEMLHRELPALTAYLQEEKVAVKAIVVHTPLAGGTEPRNSTGVDGGSGQTQRGNEGGEQQQNVRKQILDGSEGAMTSRGLRTVDEDGTLSLATYASGGSWLSVRA